MVAVAAYCKLVAVRSLVLDQLHQLLCRHLNVVVSGGLTISEEAGRAANSLVLDEATALSTPKWVHKGSAIGPQCSIMVYRVVACLVCGDGGD